MVRGQDCGTRPQELKVHSVQELALDEEVYEELTNSKCFNSN